MKKLLVLVKIILFAIIMQLCNNQLKAQLLGDGLKSYNRQIVDFLKSVEEIPDSSSNLSKYQDNIYSRELLDGGKIKFFEIGVASSHSRKYLCVLHSNDIIFFKSMVLLNDFPDIIIQIEGINIRECKIEQLAGLLKQISYIYSYNLNPPWSRN